MASKVSKITFKIVIDDNNVAKKLDKVTTSTQKTGNAIKGLTTVQSRANYAVLNTTRLVSDMPFLFTDWRLGIMAVSNNIDPLVASLTALRAEAGATTTAIKALKTALLSPAGLGVAISVVTGLFLIWSQNSRKAKEETKKITKEIDEQTKAFEKLKDMIDSFISTKKVEPLPIELNLKQLETFKNYLDDIIYKSNEAVRNSIKLFKLPSTVTTSDATATSSTISTVPKSFVDEKQVSAFEKFINQSKELSNNNRRLTEEEQALLEVLRERIDKLQQELKIRKLLQDLMDKFFPKAKVLQATSKGYESNLPELNIPQLLKPITNVEKPILDIKLWGEKEFKAEVQGMAEFMNKAFIQAWDNIFGHANSLFEMFMQSITQSLIQSFATDVAMSFLNILPGGSILGAITSLFGGSNQPNIGGVVAPSGQTVNISIDGDYFMRAVVEPRLPTSINRLQMMNKL